MDTTQVNTYIKSDNLNDMSYTDINGEKRLHGKSIKYNGSRNKILATMEYDMGKLINSEVYDSLGRIILIYRDYLVEDIRIKYKNNKIVIRYLLFAWTLDINPETEARTLIPYYMRTATDYIKCTTYYSNPDESHMINIFGTLLTGESTVQRKTIIYKNLDETTQLLTKGIQNLFDKIIIYYHITQSINENFNKYSNKIIGYTKYTEYDKFGNITFDNDLTCISKYRNGELIKTVNIKDGLIKYYKNGNKYRQIYKNTDETIEECVYGKYTCLKYAIIDNGSTMSGIIYKVDNITYMGVSVNGDMNIHEKIVNNIVYKIANSEIISMLFDMGDL